MILIFDLDDTLYDESTYVRSGFAAVARWMRQIDGVDAERCLDFMHHVLERDGRGSVFDEVLKHFNAYSRQRVRKAVQVYRQHIPDIRLFPEAVETLNRFSDYPKHLVTDGHKQVQQRKIQALGVEPYFRKLWITHRFGVHNAKPSLYCFEKIRLMEGCRFPDMVYIGDNPTKDFVNLKTVGIRTVRVLTGHFRNVQVPEPYEADIRIPSIGALHLTPSG